MPFDARLLNIVREPLLSVISSPASTKTSPVSSLIKSSPM